MSQFLLEYLTEKGVHVVFSPHDVVTELVREAMKRSTYEDIIVKTETADVICALLHHYDAGFHDIYASTKQGVLSICPIWNSLTTPERQSLLFAHCFGGCDTVSSIYNVGKMKIQQKLTTGLYDCLLSITDICKEDIIEGELRLFRTIYGSDEPLESLRYKKYTECLDRGKLDPLQTPSNNRGGQSTCSSCLSPMPHMGNPSPFGFVTRSPAQSINGPGR